MISRVELCEKIAEGGYGEVYRGLANGMYQVAVKKIPLTNEGIPCILEASIMSSIIHPSLNFALKVEVESGCLNIVQLLAKEDLINYREKNNKVDFSTLRLWMFRVTEGLYALHDQRIIHGDVKGMNVLKFGDGVKLSDYSLSRPFGNHRGKISTTTHRAPESWLNLEWGEKVDIWALGCFFFELVYGYSLFTDQEHPEASLNSIKFFINQVFRPNPKFKLENIAFDQPNIPERFTMGRKPIDVLILSCLQWNPLSRPSAQQLIKNPLFVGLIPVPGTIKSSPTIYLREQEEIKNKLKILNETQPFLDMAYQIYNRSIRVDFPDEVRLEACAWLASKITRSQINAPKSPKNQILMCEQAICYDLNFCIHYASNSIRIFSRRINSGSSGKTTS